MKKLLTSFFVLFLAISLSAQNEAVPLQIGDTVIVKQDAKRYLTGERISSWVYTVKHTIRQIGTAKWQDGVLLRGIRSWLAPSDVSPVGVVPQQSETVDTPVVETEEQPVVEQQEPVVEQQPEPVAPVAQATPYTGPIRLYGRLVAQGSSTNISGATITLANQNLSTTTNQNGEFTLLYLEPGDEELIIEADGYNADIQLIQILANKDTDLGALYLQPDMARDVKDEVLLNLLDQDLNDDEGRTQEQASSASSDQDVFNSMSSWSWSTARYRQRGYGNSYETNYIEGLPFNTAERGQFNFSAMGGLNDASRYKETVNPIEANNFSFGTIGKATNYLMTASNYAQGFKVSVAGTNRNYKAAARISYSSGPLKNGWSFMGQLAFRFSPYIDKKGIIGEGINYYSLGYFFSAEKKWG
ncbi:MAG: carboxypeptidase regulatory-like domain-containing protein, partial [Paludibacteraceae bacterium]|nr:carboxypeptidase regulatory-like domain-containing protein [Paludibacteraceae bacterium]